MRQILSFISPYNLKKYGLYAALSFFMSVCVVITTDDIKVRNSDIRYERSSNDSLQKMLNEQYKLRTEQKRLLETTKHIIIIDTLKYKVND